MVGRDEAVLKSFVGVNSYANCFIRGVISGGNGSKKDVYVTVTRQRRNIYLYAKFHGRCTLLRASGTEINMDSINYQ